MKDKGRFLIVILFFTSILAGCIGEEGTDHAGMAREHLGYLISGDIEGFYGLFDHDMKKELSLRDLTELWEGIIRTYGSIDDIEDMAEETEDDYVIVDVACLFSDGARGTVRIVYNEENEISGLWFRDGLDYTLPPYADKDSYTEVEVEVVSGEYRLPGMLTIPNEKGPFPAVVLVHGSGPNDMDETIGPNKPFKDLATGLASQGVAVLRYDKRTYAYSSDVSMNIYEFTVMEETVYDALAAIETLRERADIDPEKIYLAGHSLGAMMAPRIGSMTDGLAGIIMLAGNARNFETLVVEQVEYICNYDGVVDDQEKATIAEMKESARKISELDIGENEIILGAARAYWLDLSKYDQVDVAKDLDMPVLILQGERDYQVTMEDFNIWKDNLGDRYKVTFISYPNLNHLFMYGEGPSIGTEYLTKGIVDEDVVDDIAGWIK